ncbi:MAG TPA: metal-dependent hydrolase [Anaeromyxobacter sp.]|nr:metal-dependent hydrolase [Anaeromyxobacter sp.]
MRPRLVLLPLAALALALLVPGPSRGQGRDKVEITWYGHSAFSVRTPGGTVLLIDPWLSNPKAPEQGLADRIEKVDYILVSHGHFDHVGDAVQVAKRTGAKLITNSELANALVTAGYPKEQAGLDTVGNMGGAIQAGDATVIMVPAVHSSGFGDPSDVKVGGNPMGFVIKVKNGPTLYHTGDTDVTADMRLIPERYGPIDVMMACIGGHFTMDPSGAATAARMVRAKTVIPMHFGTFPVLTGTPEELKAALKGKARVAVLTAGKPTSF